MKSPNPTDRDQPAFGRESRARSRRGAASFNKVTGAKSRPAAPFGSRGLRRRALLFERRGRYHGGAAVAQFCRSMIEEQA
jgi:hypothetical protein